MTETKQGGPQGDEVAPTKKTSKKDKGTFVPNGNESVDSSIDEQLKGDNTRLRHRRKSSQEWRRRWNPSLSGFYERYHG